MKTIGRNMAIAGAAIVAGFGMAIKTASQFEQSMANTASVAGATTEELKKLSDYAREMGEQSVFSASQAADAMYYLASAGMNTTEIMGALKGTLDLAAATASDLAFTSEAVAASLSQFGLEASDAERIANVFAATISNSQATMDKLKISMSYVGPMASSMGMEIEEVSGILGNLYNAGIEASTAGTSLRMIFTKLIEAMEKGSPILDELGVSITDASGKMKPFGQIVDELGDAGLTAGQSLELFGQRAGPNMLALVNQGKGAIDELTKSVTGTNKASEMAATQIDTFQGAMKLLRSAFEELQITLVQDLMPAIKGLIEWLTEGIKKVSDWMKENPKLTETIVKITAGVGALMLVLGPLLMILPGLVIAFATVKTAIIAIGTTAAGPIALFIIGIIAARVACGKLTEYLRETVGGIREFREELGKMELATIDAEIKELTDSIEQLKKRFYEIPKGIGQQYILTMMDEINIRLEMLYKRREELTKVEEEAITVTDELVESEEKAKEAAEKLSEATVEIKDKILELTDPIKYQIKLLDEVIESYKEAGVANDLLQRYYDLEIALINKVAEAKKKLADLTKYLTDKIYEFTHTEYEVTLRDINREYDLLVENAKEVYESEKELIEAIKIINEERQKAIDLLKEEAEGTEEVVEANEDLVDSYEEITVAVKEAGEVAKAAGILGGKGWDELTTAIKRATVSLSNFTKEGLAAMIATIKMKFFPILQDLYKSLETAGIWADIIRGQIANVLAMQAEQIATAVFGLGAYQEALASLTPAMGGGGGFAMPSYQHGTPYVPRTGLAMVHKGEEINPPGQRSYDQRSYDQKSYKSSINIQPGAIIINTPRFSAKDAKEMLAKIKREAAMQGYKFATA